MKILNVSVKHVPSPRDQPCGVCAAIFNPAEDSGSRVLSVKAPDEDVYGALMCGGCYSKWAHGMTVSVRQKSAQA